MREDHSSLWTPQDGQAGSSVRGSSGGRKGRPGSLVLFCVPVDTEAGAICPHLGALLHAVADAKVDGGGDNGASGESTGPGAKQLNEF